MKVGRFIEGWLGRIGEETRWAEELGYDYVLCDESQHDSMLTMALAAANSRRVEMETAVTIAFARSPMILAMEAWDLQQLSEGRFILGLGTQWPRHSEQRLSVPWMPPAPRMKEFVQCLHAIWDTFQNGTRPDFLGKTYRFQLMTPDYSPGPIEYPRPKIYIGAARPAMARLAGEIADGVSYVRVTNRYMREVLLPNIAIGLERSGRSWADIDIAASGFTLLGKNEGEIEQGWERLPRLLAAAFLPESQLVAPLDEIFQLHGWDDLGQTLRALGIEGNLDEMVKVIPEAVLGALWQTSTYDDLPDFIRSHREYATRIGFEMPIQDEPDRERFQSVMQRIRQVRTPGVPSGLQAR